VIPERIERSKNNEALRFSLGGLSFINQKQKKDCQMKFGNTTIRLHSAIILFVCTVVVLALSITGVLIGERVADQAKKNLSEKTMNIARMVAHSPLVIDALKGKRDEADIQTFASEMQQLTHVRFITVMDMNHIRKSHPDKDKIGKRFVGHDEYRAIKGKEYVSIAKGTLGTSMRAFVPIRDYGGNQVGVVAVGVLMDDVHQSVVQSTKIIYIGIGIGVLVGILGAVLLARKIKTVLLGLEPFQIAKMLQERNAMFESVREGILAVDQFSKVNMVNTEAVRMFRQAGIDDQPIGRYIEDVISDTRLINVLKSGIPEYDREHDINGFSFIVNRIPVKVQNRVVGAIATFRDKTELKQLAEQLTGVKIYAEGLRVKTHEFMNQLHVILGLVHAKKYDKLSAYIHQITNRYQLEVGSVSRLVKDPVLAGFLLSKASKARENGVKLEFTGDGRLPSSKNPEMVHELITIFGNLIDNAIEAVQECEKKEVEISLKYEDRMLSLSVKDTGRGIPKELEAMIFEKAFSTKGENRGYGLFLVRKSVEKVGGIIQFHSDKGWTRCTVQLPYE
jgi:two-component system, CitB family, sensor histidine kinase MalK